MTTIVFVKPENAGNVGALARVMQNFGFDKLVLVSPKCDATSDEALARAKHAKNIVEKARVVDSFEKAVAGCSLVIGTTGKTGVGRKAVLPAKAAGLAGPKTAIVFGREGTGLSRSELEKCGLLVRIPASEEQPILNISHAAAIVLYEAWKHNNAENAGAETPASGAHKKAVFKKFSKIARASRMRDKKKAQRVFERVINRAGISEDEANILAGVLE